MAPRSIALTAEEDGIVDDLARNGRFPDADAVLREAPRLVAGDSGGADEVFGYTPDAFRAAVQVGLNDIENGRHNRFDSADDLAAHIRGRTDDILSGRRTAR